MPEEVTTTPSSNTVTAPSVVFDAQGSVAGFNYFEEREANPERFESQQSAVDYAALFAEQRAENERLKGLLDAVHIGQSSPVSNQGSGTAAKITAEQLARKMAPFELDRLTDSELAVALGMDAAPTKQDVMRFFGKDSHVEASRLMQRDPQRYYQIRGFAQLRRWV